MTKNNNEDSDPEIQVIVNKKELDKYLQSQLPYKTRPNFSKSINGFKSKNKYYGKFGNIEEAKNSNYIPLNSVFHPKKKIYYKKPAETPKIKTKYDPILERLKTNIYLLKGEYKNILKFKYNSSHFIIYLEKRNLVKEGRDNKCKMKSKIEQYKNIKKAEQNKEKEKNLKMKEEYDKNKHMKLISIKKKVEQMKIKEKNNFKLYEDNLKEIRNKKIKIKEEEKQYIKEKLSQQKNRYKKDMELRKRINREKEIKSAERIDGYEVYNLRLKENNLRNKLKIEKSLKKEILDQYYNNFDEIINKDTEFDLYYN